MSDWPQASRPPTVLMSPFSELAQGTEMAALATAAPASVAHGTANLARFYPFVLPEPIVVVKMWWYNGGTVSGNVDVGIYDKDGTKIVSQGNTAQATINVLQEVNIADTVLGRGLFYMALSASSATATFFSNANSVQLAKALGLAQMATANPLPATATLAAVAAAIQPLYGLSGRPLVV
jgi:hypothetical protein